jgi:peptidoglycan/xylan/chitin deacetylase (PgdA/CDA1 family)
MKHHTSDHCSRRQVLQAIGIGSTSLLLPLGLTACNSKAKKQGQRTRLADTKKHIVTLSFDDGFKKSSLNTAEIYEKYNLSACINVIATAHRKAFDLPNEYHQSPAGDFGLWNELKARGHEVMPHGYKHANLSQMPLLEAQDLILRCFEVFLEELDGFDPKEAVFNFPYNASTPALEAWLATRVKAFRTGGNPVNPLPHKGQIKLTCTSFGPGNIDDHLGDQIERLLSMPSGWLIYNTHGLDEEGWGPVSSAFLEALLVRLMEVESVAILPAGRALSLI